MQQFRKGRLAFLFVAGSYLLGGLIVIGIFLGLFPLGLITMGILGAWLLLFLAIYDRVYQWHCPRCGHPFFQQPPFLARPLKPCLYCGFSKWRGSGER